MTLLVAGADRVDAGKTTFSTGLIARTGAIGFKPRAGNDYWFHHDDYLAAVEDGRLFGKDARRLAAASPGSIAPEAINPVHRLWRPSPGGGTGVLGQSDREFVVDRAGETYLINETVETPTTARNQLPLADAHRVGSLAELNDAMERTHLPVLDSIQRTIGDTDRAVVESYSNVARPLQDLALDAVAVVEPAQARLYEGDRYLKGCTVATGGPSRYEGSLEERVGDVLDLIDPVATVSLSPLTDAERTEPQTVARAYEPVYDELLSLAGWERR